MRVRIIDKLDKTIEWRDVCRVDASHILTTSLMGGTTMVYHASTGRSQDWPQKTIHPDDHAAILNLWNEADFH